MQLTTLESASVDEAVDEADAVSWRLHGTQGRFVLRNLKGIAPIALGSPKTAGEDCNALLLPFWTSQDVRPESSNSLSVTHSLFTPEGDTGSQCLGRPFGKGGLQYILGSRSVRFASSDTFKRTVPHNSSMICGTFR